MAIFGVNCTDQHAAAEATSVDTATKSPVNIFTQLFNHENQIWYAGNKCQK
jgi:hypothetical protein